MRGPFETVYVAGEQTTDNGQRTMTKSLRVETWSGTGAPDGRELRRRLEAEGYGVFEWSDAPGTVYGPHAHGDDQSHWVLRGALALKVGGCEYVLEPGDRDFLPAGTTHSARVVGDGPVTYLIGAKRRKDLNESDASC
jgi:quercetin dioxygenase-like cupin family protein